MTYTTAILLALLTAAPLTQLQANALPPTNASTPSSEKLSGEGLSGEMLYLSPGKGGCATCHGKTGNEPVMPLYPKIGGQSEQYLVNQMLDYKHKRRKNGLFVPMEVATAVLSDDEIRQIAQYLARQSGFAAKPSP